jgi:hypothetical protein
MKNKLFTLVLILLVIYSIVSVIWYFKGLNIATPKISNEAKAIEIIKNQFSELKEYPSDNLPIKTIKTEKTSDGWFVAFIQEGSGRPIIDAHCFLVKNDKSVVQKKYISQDDALVGEFSAKECRVIKNVVGGDKDEHGCIGSAGYSWCQKKQRCLRVWEESCDGDSGSLSCGIESCHGLNIKCGSNPPDVCTKIYEVGDRCRQYAKCGVQKDKCQQVQNSQFTECKSCVQRCIDTNKNSNIKLFECESKCG